MPLFLSYHESRMQLGNPSNIHKHHAQKELQLRNDSYDPKDGIRTLSVEIKLSECPGEETLEEDMNEKQ